MAKLSGRGRKLLLILFFLLGWEIVARTGIFTKVVFPSITDTFIWIYEHPLKLLNATYYSLKLLGIGLGFGIAIGFIICIASIFSESVLNIIDSFISIFNPLPSISLLPFAILWFGLGEMAIIFLLLRSSIFPFSLSVLNGFRTINKIYMDIGRNYNLGKWELAWKIIIPASLPDVIIGFKQAWAGCWRTVIAAELVFGSASAVFGLGWYIFINRYLLNSAGMLGCMIIIASIGFIVENIIIEEIEEKTVRKWGMKR